VSSSAACDEAKGRIDDPAFFSTGQSTFVIASEAKQSILASWLWIASSQALIGRKWGW